MTSQTTEKRNLKGLWILLAFAALITITLLPNNDDLPVIIHPFDTTTVTIVAIAILLTPKIGVYTWNEVEHLIPWGTIIVFAVGYCTWNGFIKHKRGTVAF